MPDDPLDFDRIEPLARHHREAFRAAAPFPHAVLDDFLPPETAERVHAEFNATRSGWDHYHHYNEKKEAVTRLGPMGPHTQALFGALQSRRFVDFVEDLTGIRDLISDPDLSGAGLHRVRPGCFLNIHSDFLCHPARPTWSRQINLLIYLNKGWRPEWKGDLEFWDADMQHCARSITPIFNRCVVFHTTATSFHGHPQPLRCPPDEARKSLALYYFRDDHAPQKLSSTDYRPLPSDPMRKKILVRIDRVMLRAYSFLRRRTGLSDEVVSRILRRF